MLRTALKKKIAAQRDRSSAIDRAMANRRRQRMALRMSSPLTQQSIRTGGWANPSRMGELKFKDVAQTNLLTFNVATFEAPVLLNGLVPDSTASGRIGRKVILKSLLIRYTAFLGTTSTAGTNVRFLVVYDKQANAAAPAITDVLLSDAFTAQNNLSNRDRFVTIFDHISKPISVQGNFATSDVLFKRINLETMFNAGTAGTIGDITTGSLYLFTAQAGTLATANGGITIKTRVRYEDM